MSLTGPLLLAPDVLIIAGDQIAEEVRAQCACDEGDFVVTRPRSRTQSRVVNAPTATLLRSFRQPKTIVQAVLEISLPQQLDPERTLESVLATLTPFVQVGWIVAADSPDAQEIAPTWCNGDEVGGYRIVECAQILEDTEVYQVRTRAGRHAALKICRGTTADAAARALLHEARMLAYIDGYPAPRLLEVGATGQHPFLATTWCEGVKVTEAAAEFRVGHADRGRLLSLCRSITHAYAALHAKGVIHGDVCPNNVLLGRAGHVTILDYGLARRGDDASEEGVARQGVPQFFEPELASAHLARSHRPLATVAGEQYGLAALLYLLITGQPYLDFSAVQDVMLAQIVRDPVLPFKARRARPWPELERVIARALEKDPARRFGSLSAFAAALDDVAAPCPSPRPAAVDTRSGPARALITELDAEDISGFQLPGDVPQCSITYGAAGIAYALYRIACSRGDAGLLATADAWVARAARQIANPIAFANSSMNLTEEMIARGSVFYGRPGIHLVGALIANAMGDERSFDDWVTGYIAECSTGDNCRDLTMGRAGVLTGCALILDAVGVPGADQRDGHPAQRILDLGRALAATQLCDLDADAEAGHLGIAHGVAGVCHAALLWADVCGESAPPGLRTQLGLLAELATPHGRGLRWPVKTPGSGEHSHRYMESWCHGSPGYVHLWTAAFNAFGDAAYLRLAERAGWTVWEADECDDSLCCGYAGRAYALLNLFRHTGDRQWVDRAEAVAGRARETRCDARMRYTLYKGVLGVALLVEDLADPDNASFPMFERESAHIAGQR